MTKELSAFRRVDFHSVRRLNEIWTDSPNDEQVLHNKAITTFDDAFDRLRYQNRNPKGLIFTGDAGSGKTHLLGQIRRRTMSAGGHFVLVDCTDILHFWDTLALQYLQSLQQELDGSRPTQLKAILAGVAQAARYQTSSAIDYGMDRDLLIQLADGMVARLRHRYGSARLQRHGTIRALLYLHAADQNLSDLAFAYLQGQTLDPIHDVQASHLVGTNSPRDVVKDLSWLMSLSGPTVLALDQLDPIVTQHRLLAADENHESQAIIQGIVNGLMELMDKLEQTLPIVGMLEVSWETLKQWGLRSAPDRFSIPPITLDPPRDSRAVYEFIVRERLAQAYHAEGFSPSYPLWPFQSTFFEALDGRKPREVLDLCEQHRQKSLGDGMVTELGAPTSNNSSALTTGPDLEALDKEFAQLREQPDTSGWLGEKNEDQLGKLLAIVSEMFVKEFPFVSDIAYQIDKEFHETRQYSSLHVRLRRIFRKESDREEHICLRALAKHNPRAFQTRLTAALTTSGIQEGLSGRTLALARNAPVPTGTETEKLVKKFHAAGGCILPISKIDFAIFTALPQLETRHPDRFETWLKSRRPLSATDLFQSLAAKWLPSPPENTAQSVSTNPPSSQHTDGPQVAPPPAKPTPALPINPSKNNAAVVLAGLRDGLASQPVEFPVLDLTSHTLIRAGSGGGKTVLLKRLLEEAALAGVSSIVVDSARDLSYLGDQWPTPPEGWFDGDAQRAARYLRDVKVEIWTPGRTDGRPMSLSPLPDFRNSFDDQNEFDQAIQIATAGLGDLLIRGNSRNQPLAVLQAALKHFALQKGHELSALADLLKELPDSATPNITRAQKIARDMGDELHALIVNDPMLSPAGQTVDVGKLFGVGESSAKVSIISLFALGNQSAQASFVGRLALATFEWIRRNPAKDGIRGLFILDEASPFLPRNSSESKEALMLLAKQARKYGVGLMLATQNPKDLDYNAAAQCSTQFFGMANQPQVIDFICEAMVAKGLVNLNPGSLKPGQFYVSAPSLKQPVKMVTPMCLSWHPRNRPPTDSEILTRVK